MVMVPERVLLLFACVFAVSARAETPLGSADDPCRGRKTSVIVETKTPRLHLCRSGKSEAAFSVNLGQGGLGKRRQGDKKTPLGRYPLAAPRASVSGFTWFVPIGYPTPVQKGRGYTGGAIGIHGPPDWMPRQVIDLAFSTPWTDGCIMVRTRAEIERIREWLLEHRAQSIEILGPDAP